MADAPLVAQALPLRNWRTKLAAQLHDPFEGEAPLAGFSGSKGTLQAAANRLRPWLFTM
jgi:hypothetical protein